MPLIDRESSAVHADLPEVTGSSDAAAVITSDEYFQAVRQPNTRPALWKFADVMRVLDELGNDPLREAERRFCSPVNRDVGDLTGATPFTFLGFQLIHPGEHVPPHRHNSMAIYHILRGRGYTVVDGTKYRWDQGDTLSCPAWAYHEHVVDGDEDVLMYVIQDMPMLAAARALMWEEPEGAENIRHMVEGTSPSWSVTRTDAG